MVRWVRLAIALRWVWAFSKKKFLGWLGSRFSNCRRRHTADRGHERPTKSAQGRASSAYIEARPLLSISAASAAPHGRFLASLRPWKSSSWDIPPIRTAKQGHERAQNQASVCHSSSWKVHSQAWTGSRSKEAGRGICEEKSTRYQ